MNTRNAPYAYGITHTHCFANPGGPARNKTPISVPKGTAVDGYMDGTDSIRWVVATPSDILPALSYWAHDAEHYGIDVPRSYVAMVDARHLTGSRVR